MSIRLTSVLTLGVVLAVALTAHTEEPAAKKPLGAWEREAGEAKIRFHFTADHLITTIKTSGWSIVVHGDYGVTKGGTVFGIVTKVVKEGTGDGPSEGDLFSFHVAPDKEKLKVTDLKPGDDQAKAVIEGEYKLVPEKK